MTDLASQIANASPAEQERTRKEAFKRDIRLRQEAKREVEAESRGPVPVLRSFTVNVLASTVFPPRKALLHRDDQAFLYAGQIVEFFSTRGYGKTWLLMTLALLISAGGKAMGFEARKRHRVLYIDGEMARHDIQDRFNELVSRTGLARTDDLVVIAADWQDGYLPRLDTPEGQAAIEPFVKDADVIIFDNRGCLFDPEGEKDPAAWQAAGDYLLSLRRRDKTSILGHHANRQGGARGIGKPEDQMDLVGKLVRPDDYNESEGARFTVTFAPPDGKARGLWGNAVKSFTLKFGLSGWEVQEPSDQDDTKKAALRKKAIDILCALEKAGEALPKTANEFQKLMGGRRDANLALFAELKTDGTLVPDGKGGLKLGI
jgi:putative DNA primase/helicase